MYLESKEHVLVGEELGRQMYEQQIKEELMDRVRNRMVLTINFGRGIADVSIFFLCGFFNAMYQDIPWVKYHDKLIFIGTENIEKKFKRFNAEFYRDNGIKDNTITIPGAQMITTDPHGITIHAETGTMRFESETKNAAGIVKSQDSVVITGIDGFSFEITNKNNPAEEPMTYEEAAKRVYAIKHSRGGR